MNETVAGLLGAVVVAALTLAGNLYAGWRRRQNDRAEARSTDGDYTRKIGSTYDELVGNLQEQVDSMAKRLAAVDIERAAERKELSDLRVKVAQMDAELMALRQRVRELSEANAKKDLELSRLRILVQEDR